MGWISWGTLTFKEEEETKAQNWGGAWLSGRVCLETVVFRVPFQSPSCCFILRLSFNELIFLFCFKSQKVESYRTLGVKRP